MTTIFDNAKPVKPPEINLEENGEKFVNEQQHREQLQQSHIRKLEAEAKDTEKLTELKGAYAGAVMFFLWFWFGALCLLMLSYVTSQLILNKEIPKEVIIAAFTSTAVVVGLVGYILKGLFNGKT